MLPYLPSLVIHSAIADPGNWSGKNHKGQVVGSGCAKLWFFLRAVDYQGCGNVTIDLRIAAIALEKSLYTVRRWVKEGLRLGFFRSSGRVGTKLYRIFYTSTEKVCKRLNLANIGACTEIEVSDLKNIKFIATEVTAKQLQNQSVFQAKGKKKKNLAKCVPTAEVLTTSDLCTGAILHKAGRFTYLKFYANPHGTSQESIAQKQDRHISTIQRRLSDGYRAKHGLPPIPKTQILASPKRTVVGHTTSENGVNHSITGFDRTFKQKIWKTSLGYFRLCPNVYDIPHELVSKRRLRSKIGCQQTYEQWMASEEAKSLKKSWRDSTSISLAYCAKKPRRRLNSQYLDKPYLSSNEDLKSL